MPHLAFQPDRLAATRILPMEEVTTSYYLRMRVADRPGVLADITRILADRTISIDAMIQREPGEGEEQVDIIMLTHETQRAEPERRHQGDRGAAGRGGAGDADPARGARAELKARLARCATSAPAAACSRPAFTDILLEGLAPDGGLTVPESYPRIDARVARRVALARLPRARARDPRAVRRRHPAREPQGDHRPDVHRAGLRLRRDHAGQDARARAAPPRALQRPDGCVQGRRDAAPRRPVRARARPTQPRR